MKMHTIQPEIAEAFDVLTLLIEIIPGLEDVGQAELGQAEHHLVSALSSLGRASEALWMGSTKNYRPLRLGEGEYP